MEELVKSKLEKPKKLLQLAAREWREIDDNTLVFDRPAAEVAELKQLAKADLISFFQVSAPSCSGSRAGAPCLANSCPPGCHLQSVQSRLHTVASPHFCGEVPDTRAKDRRADLRSAC